MKELQEIENVNGIRERINEAFEFDEKLTVIGDKLSVGDYAPDFELAYFDGTGIKNVTLADSHGTVRVLNVINSIDTPVCHIETQKWEQKKIESPDGITMLTISMDLPFALYRWSQANTVEHKALSAHLSEDFGRDYGVLIREWRMLQRAVFVIDTADRIVYAEYVADQMTEPDYTKAMEAATIALTKA